MDRRTPDGLFWASITAPFAWLIIGLVHRAVLAATGLGGPPTLPPPREWLMFIGAIAMVTAIGGVIAFIAALVFAVPLLVLGTRLQTVSPLYFMLVGVATATGYFVVVTRWTGASSPAIQWAELSAAGAIAGSVYWYRVHGRRLSETSPEPVCDP